MMKIFWGLVIAVALAGCGVLKKTDTSSNVYANYSEDLTSTRITYPDIKAMEAKASESKSGAAAEADDKDLEQALQNLTRRNTEDKFYSGYTILVYSGVDRDLAFKTRNNLYALYPEIKIEMQFQQPRYLIKAGKYVNRVEAQANFHKLKENFPSARIIQDRFQKENSFNSDDRGNVDR
jgi:hypothetical protein